MSTDEASSARAIHIGKEKERFGNVPENQNSGKSGLQAIAIEHIDVVTNEAGPAHNLHVAREKERQHQQRLHRLHQFIRNEMAERHEKAKKEQSILTFKERQKTAVFLNYDLRYVSIIILLETYISK